MSAEELREKLLGEGRRERLVLHCCCAPCASYSLEYLYPAFLITCYFYNPNITDREEYYKRLRELERYVKEGGFEGVEVVDGGYCPEAFAALSKGLEKEPERGARCVACYGERLKKTAFFAKERGISHFATTLTISPQKSAAAINRQGELAAKEAGANYLPSDFKKKGGYQRSIELCKKFGLYRQNFCGCEFSKIKRVFTSSVEETEAAGERYARSIKKGDVILLVGGLGAGKTAFTRGIARGMGLSARVTSPTYAYMNDYGGLYHFDCYRLSSGEDAEGLGLTDYFYAGGVSVVEWPENITSALPSHCRRVTITPAGENGREIVMED